MKFELVHSYQLGQLVEIPVWETVQVRSVLRVVGDLTGVSARSYKQKLVAAAQIDDVNPDSLKKPWVVDELYNHIIQLNPQLSLAKVANPDPDGSLAEIQKWFATRGTAGERPEVLHGID